MKIIYLLKSAKHKLAQLFSRVNLPKLRPGLITESSVFKAITTPKAVKAWIVLAVLIALVQAIFGVLVYGFRSEDRATRFAASVIPYPVALANQSIITYKEYLTEKDYIHHFYQATDQQNIEFSEIDKEVLNQLIENKLLGFQAYTYGVSVSDKEVDEAMNQLIEQNGGKDKVEKVLDDLYGLDIEKFKKLVRTQLLRDKINDQMIMKVTARHILVRVDKDAPQEKVDEAKKKIDGYVSEIKGGLDFGEAAKKYSEDIGSADQGGSLQPFAQGEMVEQFSKAAFSAKIGEVTEPVRTDFGWHIIKVEAKNGSIEKSFVDWLNDLKDKSAVIKFIK